MRLPAFVLALTFAAGAITAGDPASDARGRILEAARTDSQAYDKLAWLTDRIGNRLSGSTNLDRAIAWASDQLKKDGIEHVWTEEVLVPHWVRNHESGRIVAPSEQRLALLALGGSIATPPGGVTGEVVQVDSLDTLRALGEKARGKIVLLSKEMQRGFNAESGYGALSPLRGDGPAEAAKLGATAALVRSLGTATFRLPHTGATKFPDDGPKIPAAAISAEDAMLIGRLLAAGEVVKVQLELGCEMLPDAKSANVLGEIRGREKPDEIVVLGAHLDSWDVGAGAIDDGAGVAMVMETMRILRKLELAPRRTLRAVLFTNEENGLRGGRDYTERHAKEMPLHVAAIETDSGGAPPVAFGVSAGEGGLDVVKEIAKPLADLGIKDVFPRGGGADIGPMKKYGVPLLGHMPDSTYYFDYHHTEADTLDKVERSALDKNVAALAYLAFSLADAEKPLPRFVEKTE
jgi:Zn-dependent M28 family amino/carboxypeptidase